MVVRKLKEGGADKSVWQPEVAKLLALKKQLAEATTNAASQNGKSVRNNLVAKPVENNGDVKAIEDEVAKQVRGFFNLWVWGI